MVGQGTNGSLLCHIVQPYPHPEDTDIVECGGRPESRAMAPDSPQPSGHRHACSKKHCSDAENRDMP